MKKVLVLSLLVISGTLFANNPDQALNNLIDAVYEGDSEVIINSLSDESIAMIDMVIMMIKAQPEEAALELSLEVGEEVTTEDILSWTAADFIDLFILSPEFISELPPRGDIDVTGYEIEGDYATVTVSLEGEEETLDVLMIKAENTWKIDNSLLESGMM